jgi:L,D-transpeptidase ErfK/SrfK
MWAERGIVAFTIAAGMIAGGCASQPPAPPADEPAVVMNRFQFDRRTRVVGEVQVTRARHEDSLASISRAYDLGYDELVEANPGVDEWFPGAGTPIVLPTRFRLPDAPREGIVLDLAARRLFFFPEARAGEPREVITHPIGIGREGTETPVGATSVISKKVDFAWVVPESIRRESAEAGRPLPERVPPGPDNPMGRFALRLGFPGILIHGTNQPAAVGMSATHGCIRLLPEDIEALFPLVPIGTPVTIVDQPPRRRRSS